MKNTIAASILAASLGLLCCSRATAANAVFAADGTAVFTITDKADFPLDKVDVANSVSTPVKVALGKGDMLVGMAAAGSNELYLATRHALWRWTPDNPRARWVEDAPKQVELVDVACHVPSGRILLATHTKTQQERCHGFYFKQNQRQPMCCVAIRYPPGDVLEHPVFLPDGSFLFSADGDLWHGMLEESEVFKPGGKREFMNLLAYRYAPIATRETYPGTPSETGISAMAVSQKKVYVHLSRMYGSGWGSILRLNLPVQKKGMWANLNSAKDIVRTLNSIEVIEPATDGGWVFLCGSSDGRRVYCDTNPGRQVIGDDEKIRGHGR